MYEQTNYVEADLASLHAGMQAWSFATLVTHGSQGIQSTPLPFLIDAEIGSKGMLISHLARHNPIYADLQSADEVLVVFQGPHAFISPSWYQNQLTFPTWNYTLIHARGKPRVHESEEAVMRVLRRTVARFDTPVGGSWDFEAVPMSHTASRLSAIAVLEIPIETLMGKMKLNQDKSVQDRLGVIAALVAQGDDNSTAVARLIRAQADVRPALSSEISEGEA